MAYIDTKYFFKCETCRCMWGGKCTTFCDHGECYSPNLSKIPTADVVPKSKYELAVAEREANVKGFTEELAKVRAEVAREIFAEIEKIIRKHDECPKYNLMIDLAELKMKYTEEKE